MMPDTIMHQVVELHQNGLSFPKIAEQLGLANDDQAYNLWRKYNGRKRAPRQHCARCGFGWDYNPVGPDGLCLWCRLEMDGHDLARLFRMELPLEDD